MTDRIYDRLASTCWGCDWDYEQSAELFADNGYTLTWHDWWAFMKSWDIAYENHLESRRQEDDYEEDLAKWEDPDGQELIAF